MSSERHAQDYEERLAAAGGQGAVTENLVKAINRTRRTQYLMVAGALQISPRLP